MYMIQVHGKSELQFSTELIIIILQLFRTESNYITIVLFSTYKYYMI